MSITTKSDINFFFINILVLAGKIITFSTFEWGKSVTSVLNSRLLPTQTE